MARARDTLAEYAKKRDAARTPEPFSGPRTTPGTLFVVQKHAARRLHYDLRLERGGTLESWAVPKGPSLRPGDKRLAVHVEDHPVEYADFEGVIPAGNYGAGAVIVWDRGWYRLLKESAGKLEIEFFGYKMRGIWTLARMSGKERDWLLLKKADAFAGEEDLTARFPESVLSGLTVEEVRDGPERLGTLRGRLQRAGAPHREVKPRGTPVMLATLVDRPFSRPGWLFEPKYDGVRVLAFREGTRVELYMRSGQEVTGRYPELLVALRALPLERFLIDGEIVALDENARPSFQRLQARMGLTRPADVERARTLVPVSGVFFDALALDGRDLRALPLNERKACLALLLPARGVLGYGDHVAERGEAFFEACCAQRLEGVVAKKADSPYGGGRSRDWLKIKCQLRQEFVIGGYTDPQGSRGYFGALHLGLYETDRLVYVSKVGTGFDGKTLKQLWDRLTPLARSTSPFATGTPAGRGHHWVEPELVCEVRFTEWTDDGGLRHPTFLGLRDDKRAQECRREVPLPLGGAAAHGRSASHPAPRWPGPPGDADGVRIADGVRVVISNPGKVFWPDEGLTKADLVAYYESVTPWLLPYLRDRPVVLTRYPDGIGGKSFYQKDAPGFAPSWVRRARIRAEGVKRDIDYLVVDDAETLRWIINLGTIPLHVWGSRVSALEHPDWLVLDLDPKGAPFADVVAVALALRRILERLDVPSYVKTSGKTGLHIFVPLGARYSYEHTRALARLLATLGVEAAPRIATVARPLRARGDKVYIDWGQNGRGQTVVAPFAVRPLPGAPISCPLAWDEVTARLDPGRFTIKNALARLEKKGDPMAPVLTEAIDIAAILARIEAEPGAGARRRRT
ncbi:MAG TPA: DNA ligase D [Methylomirabilota bacterium]|nr:DNA ligase D [Methylomirabilota bacterium]